MGDPVSATLMAVAAGAEVGKGALQVRAGREQTQQLQEQMTQEELKAAQQTTARQDQLRRTISTARVTEAARGVSLASPTFKSVTEQSFKKFQEDENAASLNLKLREDFIGQKIRQVKIGTKAAIFGDVIDGATFALGDVKGMNMSKSLAQFEKLFG